MVANSRQNSFYNVYLGQIANNIESKLWQQKQQLLLQQVTSP